MKAELIPTMHSVIDPLELMRALEVAYFRNFPGYLSVKGAAVFCAQSALETGRWKSVYNFNIGNIKAGPDYEGYYCQYRCNEQIEGKYCWFDPPHPQTNFRSYLDLEDACEDYLDFLHSKPRFRLAWDAAIAGDPDLFVHGLKQGGYFTADEAPYRAAVRSLYGIYLQLRTIDSAPSPVSEPPLDLDWERLRALIISNPPELPSDLRDL